MASKTVFDADPMVPVTFGRFKVDCRTIIMFDQEVLLGFDEPEVPGGPARMTVNLQDQDGRDLLRVVHNELRIASGHFDVDYVGRTITIRRAHREVLLRASLSDAGGIELERLEATCRGYRLSVTKQDYSIAPPWFESKPQIRLKGGVHADIAFRFFADDYAVAANREGGGVIVASRPGLHSFRRPEASPVSSIVMSLAEIRRKRTT